MPSIRHIGDLHIINDGKFMNYRIEFRKNYGVVCHGLLTSHGDPEKVIQKLEEALTRGVDNYGNAVVPKDYSAHLTIDGHSVKIGGVAYALFDVLKKLNREDLFGLIGKTRVFENHNHKHARSATPSTLPKPRRVSQHRGG